MNTNTAVTEYLYLSHEKMRAFALHELIDDYFIERSCDILVEMYHHRYDTIAIRITRIGTGATEYFYVHKIVFNALLLGEPEKALLSDDEIRRCHVTLKGRAPADPKRRRALSKAIRDHFMQYCGQTEVEIFNEGRHDYYFREYWPDGTFRMDGGLILERYSDRNVYSMHT